MTKYRIVAALFATVAAYIFLTSSSNGRATAANTGNTGAPNESTTCANCHSGGAYGVTTVSIQAFQLGTTTPVTSYIPGAAYDMRVTVTKTSGTPVGYGFQMTALTTPGNLPQSGYSNLASNVKQKLITSGTYNGRTYVEHNGVTNNNQFNFRWTAPSTGVGSIRFYAAGVCVNGNGGTGGDNAGVTSITLTQAVPLSASLSSTDPTCFGQNNGSINLTVTGGTPPYSYNWSNGLNSEDLNNLNAGTYSVTVTDATNATTTASATLTQPSLLQINVTTTNAVQPNGNGTINIQASGGTPPYTFSINGTTSSGTTEVSADCYTARVTDNLGCIAESIVCIDEPAPWDVQSLIQQVSCNGFEDGSITLNVSGATPPYTFQWSNGSENEDQNNLAAGTYNLLITDVNGYFYEASFDVTEPEVLVIESAFEPIACNGQSTLLTLSGVGGTEPYTGTGIFVVFAGEQTYQISDANGCSLSESITINEPDVLVASSTNTSLPCSGGSAIIEVTATGGVEPYFGTGSYELTSPGVYEYLVTDAVGCTALVNSTITTSDAFNFSISSANTSCDAVCDGSILVTATDFTEPLSILWNDGITELSRSELCAGQYSFSISDASGCVLQGVTSISSPSPLGAVVSTGSIACFGGATIAAITALGGVGNYTYQWNNMVLENNSTSVTAGEYNYTVSDSNGCSVSGTTTVAQPEDISITLSTTSPLCFGENTGSASALVTGGTGAYSYLWTNGAFLDNATNLTAGDISVTVTDSNDCTASASATITEPTELVVTVNSFDIASDGTAVVDLSISGGSTPYEILWTTGDTNEDVTLPANASNSAQITDANACEVLTEIFVTPLNIDNNEIEWVNIYPNPSSENPKINTATHGRLRMLDLTGKTVFETEVPAGKSELQLDQLPVGIYHARFESSFGIALSKWIKN